MSTRNNRSAKNKIESRNIHQSSVAPATPPQEASLPAPLTIFLTLGERRLVLKKLGRRHRDRRKALFAALRITQNDLDQAARRSDHS